MAAADRDKSAGYRLLDHPSDEGIEAWGNSPAEAFTQAAFGLMSILVGHGPLGGTLERDVAVAALDRENLLVRWLSEVLYLYDGERFVMTECRLDEWTPTGLRARLKGELWDVQKHSPGLNVKAVTYHQLEILEEGGRWRIRVYVDI